jgi:D-alanyl-lipoteichoic acid acyltransferase DltB (MBOAT superfamily)
MGGSKGSTTRVYANQMAVFLVSGLWHGANWTFVIWGALNGLYQILTLLSTGWRTRLHKLVPLPPALGAVLACLLTFHLVLISWVFFRASSVADAVTVLTRLGQTLPQLPSLLGSYAYTGELLLCAVLILFLLGVEIVDEKRGVWGRLAVAPVYVRWGVYYALLMALFVMGKWNLKQFIYMQF